MTKECCHAEPVGRQAQRDNQYELVMGNDRSRLLLHPTGRSSQ